MKNTLIFDQFDMVVAMTEETINDQLTHLLRIGTIRSDFIVTMKIVEDPVGHGYNYVYNVLNDGDAIPIGLSCINGKLHPQVKISKSGPYITFVLNFTSGTALFWEGFGPGATLVPYDMTGWSYGLNMNMDLYALEKKDIDQKLKVPPLVSNQLHNFLDNMFSVNSLFLDFESTNLLTFDPNYTNTSNAGDSGIQQLSYFMEFYLKQLIREGNPYILGYAVNVNNNSVIPRDQMVPDPLKPTGTTYTMFYDPANQQISNLNYALVSKGGFGKVTGSAGTFDSNWISPSEQCNAKMIIGHQDLLEALLIQPLYESLKTGAYSHIKGHVDVPPGKEYAQAKSMTANGIHYSISDITAGDDQYQNYFDVSFDNKPGLVNINISGYVHLYKKRSKNILGCDAMVWALGNVNWTGQITIQAGKDKNGNPILSIAQSTHIGDNNTDSYQSPCAKGLEWVLGIIGTILDLFSSGLNASFFTLLLENLLNTPDPEIGNIGVVLGNLSNSIPVNILLPAGQVFYFKNPAFDLEGNFSLELTYISNQ